LFDANPDDNIRSHPNVEAVGQPADRNPHFPKRMRRQGSAAERSERVTDATFKPLSEGKAVPRRSYIFQGGTPFRATHPYRLGQAPLGGRLVQRSQRTALCWFKGRSVPSMPRPSP
jgi:hypothetical protein